MSKKSSGMDDVGFDDADFDDGFDDETESRYQAPIKIKKGDARRRYERMVEERRLRKELEDDLAYW